MTTNHTSLDHSQGNAWLAIGQEASGDDHQAPVMISVDDLSGAYSPRILGQSKEHVEAIAAVPQEDFPPILVHRETMRVIDGSHRLTAARIRGEKRIPVKFFCGNEADAFVLAVKSNVKHGLPLSLADRRLATERIILSHQHWSDRMIASVTGLGARTVSEIRERIFGQTPWDESRVGQDGRMRPVNASEGRALASKLMMEDPSLSLRQVSQAAGISPETARDVRKRLQRGEEPTIKRPKKKRPTDVKYTSDAEITAMMERLKADPALRYTEDGRVLLRLLHANLMAVAEWRKITENVPLHCSNIVMDLAISCSRRWLQFAELLEHAGDALLWRGPARMAGSSDQQAFAVQLTAPALGHPVLRGGWSPRGSPLACFSRAL